MRVHYLVLAAVMAAIYYLVFYTPAAQPADPVLNHKLYILPVQGPPRHSGIPFADGNLTFLASYELTARVLSTSRYRFDYGSKIAPFDFALGWGPMSGPKISEKLSVSQGARFYHYSWSDVPPVEPAKIIVNSANVHLIPKDDEIKRQLGRVSKNQIVTLKGHLVKYREDDGNKWWQWTSSMTRSDTGAGACELFYVEEVITY